MGAIPALLAFTILLFVLVLVIGIQKSTLIAYTVIALIALTSSWLDIVNPNDSNYMLISQTFSFVALVLAMVLIMKSIFASNVVTIDTIAESLCMYLLLGFAFAYIYTLIDVIFPNSFMSSVSNEYIDFSHTGYGLDKIYFSFITLLTIGYGDIVPVSHLAKLTSIVEGFFGQIFIVVLIARLVGMHVSQGSNSN